MTALQHDYINQWLELGTTYKFIKNWDANYQRNLEESVICIIFYTVDERECFVIDAAKTASC